MPNLRVHAFLRFRSTLQFRLVPGRIAGKRVKRSAGPFLPFTRVLLRRTLSTVERITMLVDTTSLV